MSDPILRDKKVEVQLDRTYVTNGYAHGHVDGDIRKPFIGKTTVNEQDARDLEERMKTYKNYDDSRHRDNGRQINSGAINGGGN